MILSWLKKAQAPKFLRYLFFIAYSWYRKYAIERPYAEDSAILFIALGYMMIFSGLIQHIESLSRIANFLGTFISTGLVAYYLFWYKKKWKKYIEEFQHIKRKKQWVGLIYLFLYIFFCICFSIYPVILEEFFGVNVDEFFK